MVKNKRHMTKFFGFKLNIVKVKDSNGTGR